jgi:TetR/AcrR family transcriptional regulator, cholesterol catabolism regulator
VRANERSFGDSRHRVPERPLSVLSPRRRDIEQVASSLFRERGYAATSVRDIARALDLQGASLYAHVASKEDVLWAIVDRVAARFEAAAAVLDDRSRSVPDRLDAFVRVHIAVLTSDIEDASVFLFEWRSLSGERRSAMLERRDAYERRLRRAIAEGVERGELRGGTGRPLDPPLAAAFVLTALNGIATWYRPDGARSADAIADEYAVLVLGALGAHLDPGDRVA